MIFQICQEYYATSTHKSVKWLVWLRGEITPLRAEVAGELEAISWWAKQAWATRTFNLTWVILSDSRFRYSCIRLRWSQAASLAGTKSYAPMIATGLRMSPASCITLAHRPALKRSQCWKWWGMATRSWPCPMRRRWW